MARTWLAMCKPSATRASEPKTAPPPISSTIIAAHSPITAQVLRSLPACPAPRNTWLWPPSIGLSASWLEFSLRLMGDLRLFQIAVDDVDQLFGRLGARVIARGSRVDHVLADVILDDLGDEAVERSAAGGRL